MRLDRYKDSILNYYPRSVLFRYGSGVSYIIPRLDCLKVLQFSFYTHPDEKTYVIPAALSARVLCHTAWTRHVWTISKLGQTWVIQLLIRLHAHHMNRFFVGVFWTKPRQIRQWSCRCFWRSAVYWFYLLTSNYGHPLLMWVPAPTTTTKHF